MKTFLIISKMDPTSKEVEILSRHQFDWESIIDKASADKLVKNALMSGYTVKLYSPGKSFGARNNG